MFSGNYTVSDMIVKDHYVNEAILYKDGKNYVVYSGCIFEYTISEPKYDWYTLSNNRSYYLPTFYNESGAELDYESVTVILKDGTKTNSLDVLVSNVEKIRIRYDKDTRSMKAPSEITSVLRLSTKWFTSMYAAFKNCSKLVSVNAKRWDTRNITDIGYMFAGCSSLLSLDLSDWNTDKITFMGHAFYNCTSLTSIDLSSWNTSNAIERSNMFSGIPDLGIFGWAGYNGVNYSKPKWDLTESETGYISIFPWNMEFTLQYTSFGGSHYTIPTFYGLDEETEPQKIFRIVLRDGTYTHDTYTYGVKRIEYLYDVNTVTKISFANTQVDRIEKMIVNDVWNDLSEVFMCCEYLTYVNGTENWDTRNVVSMSKMFYETGRRNRIEFKSSNWNTGNVTDMSYMFYNCGPIEINLNNWNTGNVTDMSYMFSNTSSTSISTSLDLSRWNTGNVTDMSYMFNYAVLEENITGLSNWDTGNVTDMKYMFYSARLCENISDLSSWDTGNVTNMESMFHRASYNNHGGASTLKLNLSNWDTGNVTNTFKMFYGLRLIDEIGNISNWDTNNITDMSYMFGSSSIKTLNLSNWSFSNVTNMNYMFSFSNLKSLDLSNWDTRQFKERKVNYSSLFYDMPEIKNALWGYNGVNYKNFTLTEEKTDYGYHPKTAEETHYYYTFPWNKQFISLFDYSIASNSYTNEYTAYAFLPMKNDSSSIYVDDNNIYKAILTNGSSGNINTPINNVSHIYVLGEENSTVKDITFKGNKLVETVYNLTVTNDWTTMTGMFNGCKSLQEIEGINLWDVSSITNVENLFNGCSSLTSLDLSTWDTNHIRYMNNMFLGIPDLVVYGWNYNGFNYENFTLTEEQTGYAYTFPWNYPVITSYTYKLDTDCTPKVSVNDSIYRLSKTDSDVNRGKIIGFTYPSHIKFDNETTVLTIDELHIENPTLLDNMCYNCSSLTYINLSGINDTSNVVNMDNIFFNCKKLTSLDLSSWDTSSLVSAKNLFYRCEDLTSLDVSSWNTGKIQDMEHMFDGCKSLNELNVSNWNTKNVTDMSFLFYECEALTSLNLSKWNTNKVKSMECMFAFCRSVTSLQLRNFNVYGVDNMSGMFSGCTSLNEVDLSTWSVRSYFTEGFSCTDMFNNVPALTWLNYDATGYDGWHVSLTEERLGYSSGKFPWLK